MKTLRDISDLTGARRPLTPMKTHFATKENTRFVKGRREWLEYLDTRIAEASDGRAGATMSAAHGAMAEETGWHYHECEMQIGLIMKGWIDMQYEDGTEVRLEAGDVLFVPGGVVHNEVRASEDLAGFEVTIPADMGTVPVDPPENWKPRTGAAGSDGL